ncbi:adp-ribosyl cyclase cyclic adp-ribose hydrolase 2 [Limosa lapponica baueri]|uniref:ADP-ribosyl cyclase/cyclic ADP-ribose hydrolase n=1 Tax=Limosa lapponica baueri TaxID=1758121 RepID=A0A2I0TQJ2_LIMLA|nr:adp-ribosyl cyclase cyclic adp-ribose hydrolase 2 [Limosa lapponica baueri]
MNRQPLGGKMDSREDLVIFYKNLHGEKISECRFFINAAEKDIMRSNDWKLKVDKFRPELRFESEGYQTIGTFSLENLGCQEFMMKSPLLSLLLVSVLFMNSFSEVQGRKWKGEGTTRNLENIAIGRCYDYIRIVNPAVGEKNCSGMWEAFKNAFINKDPCSILPKDYELFINLSLHTIPPNKSLFWENNQLLVNTFGGRGRRYMSLGDTLFGFFGDFLNWCGQAESAELDYESCPTMEECENNAVDSFWRMASITSQEYLLSNGDSCGTHTVKKLENRLKTLGYDVTCTDNYK